MRSPRWIVAIIVMVVISSAAFAQFGRQRFRGYRFGYEQNEPPNTEFVFARWEYSSSRGWDHDYPDAEEHINQIMDEATGINVERMSYKIVPMESEEIFEYPFGYISERVRCGSATRKSKISASS